MTKKQSSTLVLGLCFGSLLGTFLAAHFLKSPFWLGGVLSAVLCNGTIILFCFWGIVNADYFVRDQRMNSSKKSQTQALTQSQLGWQKVTVVFFIGLIFAFLWAQIPLMKDTVGLLSHGDIIETKQGTITINDGNIWTWFADQTVYVNPVDHYQLYGNPAFLRVGDEYKLQVLKNSGTIVGYEKVH